MLAPEHPHLPRRPLISALALLLIAGALVLAPAPEAAAAGTLQVAYSPGSPTAGDAISVTVWVDCTAGAPNVLPSLYYMVDGPAYRNNYYSTTHWEGSRATATVTFPVGDLPAGTYSVYGYGRDSSFNTGNCLPSSYNFSNTSILQMVVGSAKVASTTGLAVSDDTPHVGDSITFTATVTGGSGTPTGTVTFSDGAASLGSATLNGSGQATLATSAFTAGSHSVTAAYGGNATYNASSSSPVAVTVKHATSTSLEASDAAPRLGDEVTFTATVTSAGGIPTGSVTFSDGAASLGSATLDAAGQATLATSALGIGSHTIGAAYQSDSTHDVSSGSAVVVVDQWPGVSFSPPHPTTDDAITVTVWVDCAAGSPNVVPSLYYMVDGPTEENDPYSHPNAVQWDANQAVGTITFPAGTFPAGEYDVYGYGRDSSFNEGNCLASSFDFSFTETLTMVVTQVVAPTATALQVSDPAPGWGQEITFTATVTGGSGTPTGTVTFSDGAASLGSATLDASGQATLATAALAPGAHSVTASYQGDFAHDPSASAPVEVNVGRAGSTTALEASDPTPGWGEEITFTATVTGGPGTPTGTVTFADGATSLGSATLDGAGQATLATSALAPGAHSVTASYQGDSAHEPSASAPVEVNVGRAGSTTALEASDTSTYPGEEITFTASVSCALGTPTGTVTFSDGPTSLGSATLDGSGEATLATSALALGTHAITADYGGDTLCGPSASSELGVAVAAAPAVDTTLILTVNPEAGPRGGTFTLTATLTPASAPGTIAFTADGAPLGTAPLAAGVAAIEVFGEDIAGATIAASYAGAEGYAPAQAAGISAAVEEPGLGLDSATAAVGGEITVTGAGFAPGGTLQVWLHSDPILLGEVVADADGRFTAVFTLPAGLTGEHEIRVVGESASGETLEATTGLAIAADVFDPPDVLPLTGGSSPLIPAGVAIMLLGAMALALGRRRQKEPNG